MAKYETSQSLVGRLVVCIACFGVLASLALAVLSFRQTQRAYRVELSSRIASTAGTLCDVVRGVIDSDSAGLEHLLSVFARDADLRAVKVWDTNAQPAIDPVLVGSWLEDDDPQPMIWTLDEHTPLPELALDPRHITEVRIPFEAVGHELMLEVLVDGPAQHRAVVHDTAWRMLPSWAVLAVATLLASIALRLWVLRPLNEVVSLIEGEATGEAFERIAESRTGEHGQLARALAERLSAAEHAEEESQRREAALTQLFEFAPAALVEVDAEGVIHRANARALRMLETEDGSPLGQPLRRLIEPADRPTLRQLFARLQTETTARCELRLRSAGGVVSASVEAQADCRADGQVASIRVALADRTRTARLHDRLAQQARLLELTLDHLDEAVLLTDGAGRVVAHNRPLENLLQQNRDQIRGAVCEHGAFWSALGLINPEEAVATLKKIERDDVGMAHATLPTRQGPLRFRGIRVRDAGGEPVGRLWIITPESGAVASTESATPGPTCDDVLHRFSRALMEARDPEGLVVVAAEVLRELLGTEAVGIAVRSADAARRCRMVIHRGTASLLAEPHRAWADAVATELMPDVLARGDVQHWAEPPADAGWSAGLRGTGLQALAAAPLCASRDDLGVLWIAEVPGRSLSVAQRSMLEASAVLLASRLEYLELGERFCDLGVLDPDTLLPTADQFERHAARATLQQPGRAWSAVVLRIDNYAAMSGTLSKTGYTQWVEQLGDRLRARCRRSCFISRLADDAFAVWAPDLEPTYAQGFAQRLRAALEQFVAAEGAAGSSDDESSAVARTVVSAGLACYPQDGRDPAVVLGAAARRGEKARRLGNPLVARDADADRAAS